MSSQIAHVIKIAEKFIIQNQSRAQKVADIITKGQAVDAATMQLLVESNERAAAAIFVRGLLAEVTNEELPQVVRLIESEISSSLNIAEPSIEYLKLLNDFKKWVNKTIAMVKTEEVSTQP